MSELLDAEMQYFVDLPEELVKTLDDGGTKRKLEEGKFLKFLYKPVGKGTRFRI